MSRITPRAVLATIFIALIASGPALAELPRHVRLQTWQPLPEEQSLPRSSTTFPTSSVTTSPFAMASRSLACH